MNIKNINKPVTYPLGTYEKYIIKDRTKHAKMPNTSSKIKKLRDQGSTLNVVQTGLSPTKDDKELLKYNMKTGEVEYKYQQKKVLHKTDTNAGIQNIGDPIRHAGVPRKGKVTSRGSISRKFYDSQIVLGNDENYMPMSTQKMSYTNLVLIFWFMDFRNLRSRLDMILR